MKKIIIVLFLFVTILLINKGEEEYIIPNNAIRLRVIANSNTFEDQATKLEIKNNIETILKNDLFATFDKKEVDKKIDKKIPEIKTMINSYNLPYQINYGQNYFPEKSYKGIKYESGMYDSLVVTLGSGEGENWWCVLFPPLCLMDASITNSKDVEYSLFVKDIFKKYM